MVKLHPLTSRKKIDFSASSACSSSSAVNDHLICAPRPNPVRGRKPVQGAVRLREHDLACTRNVL